MAYHVMDDSIFLFLRCEKIGFIYFFFRIYKTKLFVLVDTLMMKLSILLPFLRVTTLFRIYVFSIFVRKQNTLNLIIPRNDNIHTSLYYSWTFALLLSKCLVINYCSGKLNWIMNKIHKIQKRDFSIKVKLPDIFVYFCSKKTFSHTTTINGKFIKLKLINGQYYNDAFSVFIISGHPIESYIYLKSYIPLSLTSSTYLRNKYNI